MGVKLWVNRGHIYLSLCYGGKQWRESTGLTVPGTKSLQKEVMKLAEELRCRREMEMAAAKSGMIPPEKRGVTLYDYIRQKGGADYLLSVVERYGGKNVALASVTRTWLETFQAAIAGSRDFSISSAETYCVRIRSFLHKAVLDGYFDRSPYDGIPHLKKAYKPRLALTADEVRRLSETECPGGEGEEIKRAFLFSCYTGLRVSDVASLRQADIDRAAMMIRKQQVKTSGAVYIPLSEEALKLAGDTDPPFPYLAGLKCAVCTNRLLHVWGVAAGIEKPVTWHIARHTAATLLLEAGADVYTVQHILGHTSVSTTQIYAEVSGGRKRKALDALADLIGGK